MSALDFPEFNLPEIIDEYKEFGVVVVPIFSAEEVAEIRDSFHRHLGIDHNGALSGDPQILEHLGGARMKSRASDTFAPLWKLNVVSDPRIIHVARALMAATFGPGDVPGFSHPLGASDDIRIYLDRAQYRLPDHVRAEGGLGLHLDRNPLDPYFLEDNTVLVKKNKKVRRVSRLLKFRPIQSFISLTDQYGAESGGLRVIRGFHKEIDQYFQKCRQDLPDVKGGEFYRMDSKVHANLWKRVAPVDAPAGSIVFWDNRLAHSTAEKLTSSDTREVLYTSYLPYNPLNQQYLKLQLDNLKRGLAPPAYNLDSKLKSHYDFQLDSLSPFQQKMLCVLDF